MPPLSKSKLKAIQNYRLLVQLMVLPLLLWPSRALSILPKWMKPAGFADGIPGCTFHCYACPLSSVACPIGLIATATATGLIPWLTIGVIFLVAGLFGSLFCGWLCPFGLLQDLLDRIPTPKFNLPNAVGIGRFVMLGLLVLLFPYLWGKDLTNLGFICNICPVGAIEGGLPWMTFGPVSWSNMLGEIRVAGENYIILRPKYFFAGTLVILMLFTRRPWCRMLCPLGGLLAIFNRVSLFRLRLNKKTCISCHQCTENCPMTIDVEKQENAASCIRCGSCAACDVIKPTFKR